MKQRLSSPSFWTGPFLIGMTLVLSLVLGIGWYIVGGLPRDHDRYGTVNVPGQDVLELPSGDVRLNFENDAFYVRDDVSINAQPDGLVVRVTPVGGGKGLEVRSVPSWIYSSIKDDRGHEPWGKVDVPEEGRYVVQATAAGLPRLGSDPLSSAPPADDSGPEITVGAPPWTPFGSRLAGAVVFGALVFGVGVVASWVIGRIAGLHR